MVGDGEEVVGDDGCLGLEGCPVRIIISVNLTQMGCMEWALGGIP